MIRWLAYLVAVMLLVGLGGSASATPPTAAAGPDDFCGSSALRCARTGAAVCTCTLQTSSRTWQYEAAVVSALESLAPLSRSERSDLPEPSRPLDLPPAPVPTPPPRV